MSESREKSVTLRRSVPALAVLVLASTCLPGCGDREPDDTMVVDVLPERIGEWTREGSPASYDRETIFDYIDGAGEVYRSYAFDRVLVVGYTNPAAPAITVELFDMGNPADAYGVFSYAREREETGIGGGYEQRGRVLCFWQDRYYVCVASEERDADSDRAIRDVARAISERLPPASDPPDLVSMLPSEGLVPFSQRFFHLHQSLNYHYYLARENILGLTDETDAVLARYAPGSTYLLLVRYANGTEAAAAVSSFRQGYLLEAGESRTVESENGAFLSYGRHGRFLAVVLDAVSEDAADALLQATLNGLTESPD